MSKAVVIYSGGMDSYTLLRHALQHGHEVHALSFDYGQRHGRELRCAETVCERLGVQHHIVQLNDLKNLLRSSLTEEEWAVPTGHYAAPNMQETVVPNRNMIMLSIAAGHALSLEASVVYYGAHSGDHTIYPDCRPEFVEAVNAAVNVGNWGNVTISAPFVEMTKGQILDYGLSRGWDYADTWTCYNGREKACGVCGSCTERLEAFKQCGAVDPVEYENG